MQLIQTARENIYSLLEEFDMTYEVTPFDHVLYQECIDDSTRRGYPVDGDSSVRTFLREGVIYAANTCAHLPHRPTLIWIAVYTSCTIFVDEVFEHFPAEIQNIYHFNNRFIRNEPQGSSVLDAYADVIRRIHELYPPVASYLITTSTLNFVAANLLEYETTSMKISKAAQQYPLYKRTLSGAGEAYSFIAFPREIPLNDYIQAIPEMTPFINITNDVLSFYKEERAGETNNQISTLAARTKKSKLEAFRELTEVAIGLHKKILDILEGSPEACNAWKQYAAGYLRFHFSSTYRYHIDELDL